MKCYKVICKDETGKEYSVGIMTSDSARAMQKAVESLLEGSHVHTTAISVSETAGI